LGKIVFASGVFDILHAGHIGFFKKAKKFAGDDGTFIVATHDDKSISAAKGENRPVNKAADRIEVLNSIKYIDAVILWNGWENIQELVMLIKPDFIVVSGKEYKNKFVEQFCKENRNGLKVFPRSKRLSTTQIINKIQLASVKTSK